MTNRQLMAGVLLLRPKLSATKDLYHHYQNKSYQSIDSFYKQSNDNFINQLKFD